MTVVSRHVRGVLFVDYVRMLRSQKDVDWSQHLPPEDVAYLGTKIEPEAWYPMATFERLGNEILRTTARGQLFTVQLWGRYSAGQLRVAHPTLLAPLDPIETVNRFRVMRQTFFDFSALDVPLLHDDEAHVVIHYYMGMPAEEAASYQTLGFFEGLLELAGARDIEGTFTEKSWAGDRRTLAQLHWNLPGAS
jgi:hypothetical protein